MDRISSPVNAANIDKSSKRHPLKKRSFIGMARVVSLYKMSDKAFRTLCFIIGAHGDDGLIFFKRATLAELIQGSTNKVDNAILELKAIGLIDTKNWKGRALQFFLTDKCYDDQPREVPQNDETRFPEIGEPLITDKKNYKRKTTTAPKPKPKPKSPPAPPAEIAVVAYINNIKKIIEPEISLSRNALEKLIGIDYDHIRYAKNEAMKPGTKNKNGLFIYLCNEEISPMEKLKNGLDTVEIPKNIDGNSVEMRKITCYNRNVSNLTCTSILGNEPATKECLQFCPFYLRRMEQDLKLYHKICVEIVHETDKAFLVHPVDSLNEHWIPKRVIKKQESYGDDSFLLTIPKSFELKNVGYCGQNGMIK